MDNSLQTFIHLLSAMTTNISVLLLITLWASIQDGLGLPVVPQEVADDLPARRERTKRCSCSSPLDSECHYFCHLDIIWVNTPSKTTLYGLGNVLSRRRRSASRCTCANPYDQSCTNFCRHRSEISSSKRSVKRRQLNILSILRAVATRSKRALDAPDSDKAQSKSAR